MFVALFHTLWILYVVKLVRDRLLIKKLGMTADSVAWFRFAVQGNFINAKKNILGPLQAKLNEALSGPVEALLDGANSETWPTIKKLLQRETESAVAGVSNALSGFDMDEQSMEKILTGLENYAKGVVEAKAREQAGRVLILMKDRCQLLAFFQLSYF